MKGNSPQLFFLVSVQEYLSTTVAAWLAMILRIETQSSGFDQASYLGTT